MQIFTKNRVVSIIALLLWFFAGINCYAQKEANNWFLGTQNGLTFNSGSPQNIPCSNYLGTNGTAVASDSAGNLLFYTDGLKVYTRSHQIMQNGDGLLGTAYYQSCITFPKPGSKRFYYIFVVGNYHITPLTGIRYSLVDIEANGGEGKVIYKNFYLSGGDDAMDVLTATVHRNNRDVWVVTRKQAQFTYTYSAYLVTPTGIHSPVYSIFKKTTPITQSPMGTIRISPDGKKFIDSQFSNNLFGHFDNNLGTITRFSGGLDFAFSFSIGTEFSPSSKYLYICGTSNQFNFIVLQFDANAIDSLSFQNSQQLVGFIPNPTQSSTGMFLMMQSAPDGKLYGVRFENTKLFTLNYPDKAGLGSDFQYDGYDLNVPAGKTLPQFVTSYVQRFFYQGSCVGLPYRFTSNFHPVPDSIHWDFGDGSSSTLLNPTHIYALGGNYSVVVFARFPDGKTGDAQRDITVAELPHPNLGSDITLCKGTSVKLLPGSFTSYVWSNGASDSTIVAADTGQYWVQVANPSGCINRDTVQVAWFSSPVLDETRLNVAPTTCNSSTGAITSLSVFGLEPLTYTWKNGSGAILGNEPDIFHLPVDNYTLWVLDSAGCETPLKMYTIRNIGDSLILSVDHINAHCNRADGSIAVNATAGLSNMLLYAIDTSNFLSNQGLFRNLLPGSYQIWVKDSLGCKKVYDGNPVVVQNLTGPLLQPSVVQDETGGQSNGSISIIATSSSDTLWYSIGGSSQLNNGNFDNLPANTYVCTVTDKFGCDTTFTVILKNILLIRLQAIAGDGSVCLGKVAVLPLLSNNFTKVGSFDTRLLYDKTLVICQNYLNAYPLLADSLQLDLFPALGELNLRWTGKESVSLPDGTSLLELSFASLDPGQSQLKWDLAPGISIFRDSLGSILPSEFTSGEVRVYSIPEAEVVAPLPSCVGRDILLMANYQPGTGNGAINYNWSGPDGFTAYDAMVAIISVKQSDAGQYTLNISDTNHCQNEYNVLVNVIPTPVVGFTADTIYFDEQIELEAEKGYYRYAWSTGDSTCSVLVKAEGWYKVTLQTAGGCTATDSVLMIPAFAPFTMPNAFTPNSDGLNDVFRPVTQREKLSSFSMYIFDRWGKQVFFTNDISKGWDGTNNGSPAMAGGYAYTLKYSNNSGISRGKKGMVMLVR